MSFDCRESGLHAMCVALQIHLGPDLAFTRMDKRWDDLRDGDSIHCVELAMLLQGEGLPAVASVGPAARILEDCMRAYGIGWTCMVQLHPLRAEQDRRWAVLWECSPGRIVLAECSDGVDVSPLPSPIVQHLTGEAVVVEAAVGGPITVFATPVTPM